MPSARDGLHGGSWGRGPRGEGVHGGGRLRAVRQGPVSGVGLSVRFESYFLSHPLRRAQPPGDTDGRVGGLRPGESGVCLVRLRVKRLLLDPEIPPHLQRVRVGSPGVPSTRPLLLHPLHGGEPRLWGPFTGRWSGPRCQDWAPLSSPGPSPSRDPTRPVWGPPLVVTGVGRGTAPSHPCTSHTRTGAYTCTGAHTTPVTADSVKFLVSC